MEQSWAQSTFSSTDTMVPESDMGQSQYKSEGEGKKGKHRKKGSQHATASRKSARLQGRPPGSNSTKSS